MNDQWFEDFIRELEELGYSGTVNHGWVEYEYFEKGYTPYVAAMLAYKELENDSRET